LHRCHHLRLQHHLKPVSFISSPLCIFNSLCTCALCRAHVNNSRMHATSASQVTSVGQWPGRAGWVEPSLYGWARSRVRNVISRP
jgi:hypothetical protein